MKTFFMTLVLFISYSSFAQSTKLTPSKTPQLDSTPQTQVLPKAAPNPSSQAMDATEPEPTAGVTPQKQEQSPGVKNDYPIGDYDKDGNYIFFDRLEREQKEAADEAAEQQM